MKELLLTDSDIAKLDDHRVFRNGFTETIYCEGKRLDHLLVIVRRLLEQGKNFFGTRAEPAVGEAVTKVHPGIHYDEVSRTFQLIQQPLTPLAGSLAILCAGTADIGVAEEAWRTAAFSGVEARRFYDVGVAGLPRLLRVLPEVNASEVVIVIAGMEGALPSVVGGLLHAPIIAVPTSAGYGSSRDGMTALFAMLSSCAEGIAVVNINNGFGAACAALRILRASHDKK